MSADCETVTPSMGSETLQHTLTLPQNTSIRSDRHSHQGISYEGRVSLISPLGQYEDSLRSTFGNGQGPNISPPHMYSPPFQSTEFPPSSNAGSFGVSEETQRVLLSMHSMNYGASGSNKNYDSYQKYQMDYSSQKPTYIKEEAIDMVSHNRPTEPIPSSRPSSSPSQSSFLNSDINTDADVSTIDKNEINSPFLDMPKTTNPPSLPEDFNGLNGTENPLSEDHSSDGPSSPFAFNDNGPPSVNSDQNEYREIDPVTFMKASYNGIHDIFNLHGENSKALKCQFCLYSTDDESSFTSHLNSHFIHKCMKCEYTTKTVDQLKEHLLAEHGINPEDIVDIESTKVPYMNSQGKVKTFKCKQCGFVAVTKGEFWTHAKSHIKSEKLLSCNKCQFVTEYKHHLEYHMRNHFGSKPFKCNKCSYSCVNKSMLNSHMKSHSNIYQYRCSDCTYATKYCHSLKLHLRKYAHTPAMVLNPDGSPNPVPIIDVYGTRRGPKLKKDENGMPILPPHYQLQAHIVRAQMEITGTIPPAPTVPIEKCNSSKNANKFPWNIPVSMASFPNQPQLPQVNNKNKYPSFIPNEYKDPIEKSYESQEKRAKIDTSSNNKEQNLNVSKSPEVEETLLCDICNFSTSNKDILSHHVLLHNQNKREPERNEFVHSDHGNHKINLADMMSPKSMNLNFMKENNIKPQKERQMPLQPQIPSQFPPPQNVLHDYFVRAINPLLYPPMIPGQNFVHPALEIQHQIQRFMYQNSKDHNNDISMESPTRRTNGQTDPALNLSKEQTPPNSGQHSSHGQPSTFPTFLPASPPSSDISTPPSKSRRKGRAYKLERIASRLSGSGEDENSESPKIGNHTQSRHDKIGDLPPLLPLDLAEHKNSNSCNESKWGEAHQCQYCDIAFKDIVMYTMHMGYHGYEDPFKCNMCGFDATDKVAFFLHIGRSSHL